MDEINEQTENMKQIQEALATPTGAAADFDEVLFSVHNFCPNVTSTYLYTHISIDFLKEQNFQNTHEVFQYYLLFY